jgi:hypothetical protein
MTPQECIAMAEKCERMAFDCTSDLDRRMLLAAASHWQTLAAVAGKPPPGPKASQERKEQEKRDLVSS